MLPLSDFLRPYLSYPYRANNKDLPDLESIPEKVSNCRKGYDRFSTATVKKDSGRWMAAYEFTCVSLVAVKLLTPEHLHHPLSPQTQESAPSGR